MHRLAKVSINQDAREGALVSIVPAPSDVEVYTLL